MIKLSITHIGKYTHVESGAHTPVHASISFQISGFEHFESEEINFNKPNPYFRIGFPGECINLTAGKERENFVAQFDTADLIRGTTPDKALLRVNDDWIPISRVLWIPASTVPLWRQRWETMVESARYPIAKNIFAAQVGLMEVIQFMLEHESPKEKLSPEMILRHKIDADRCATKSLEALSRECGISTDHMRELFGKKFGISPRTYRIRRRIAEATELIATSQMSVKQIAHELGFRHVSHFCTFYMNQTGIQPGLAIKQLRHG